jgi:uncharacterized protein YuzE
MPEQSKFDFTVSRSGDCAYLGLPLVAGGKRKVAKNLRLNDLVQGYCGPDVVLDFDSKGQLLGIEILL